jgi:hypothetical protein
MRTSNIILLSLAFVVLATATTLAAILRYKVDHLHYAELIPSRDAFSDVPLGPFSVILVDGVNDVTVREGGQNLLRLSQREGNPPSYRLYGDTLKVWSARQGEGTVRIVVRDLRTFLMPKGGDCVLSGLHGDSLSVITGGEWGTTSIDSADLLSLRLNLGVGKKGLLSRSNCRMLWADMDSSANLGIDSSRIDRLNGRWVGDATFNVDGVTLSKGIQMMQHIQQ